MKTNLTREDKSSLYDLLELGLTTDGGHHKQWVLVKIAELFGVEVEDELKEEAIAP